MWVGLRKTPSSGILLTQKLRISLVAAHGYQNFHLPAELVALKFDLPAKSFTHLRDKRRCARLLWSGTRNAVIAEHQVSVGIKAQPFPLFTSLAGFSTFFKSSLPVLFYFLHHLFSPFFAVVQMLLSQMFTSQQLLNGADDCIKAWSGDFQSWSDQWTRSCCLVLDFCRHGIEMVDSAHCRTELQSPEGRPGGFWRLPPV